MDVGGQVRWKLKPGICELRITVRGKDAKQTMTHTALCKIES